MEKDGREQLEKMASEQYRIMEQSKCDSNYYATKSLYEYFMYEIKKANKECQD